jgi:tetratricopeptide (TPR) repeat protein
LYGDEETFYTFCRQNGVNYFIYSAKFFLDYTTVGTRFLADRLAVDPASFTSMAHFHPEQLRHFALRYQNDCFRIYEVLEDGEQKADWPVDYQPIFDPLYAVQTIDQAKRFGDEISFASYLYYSGVEAVRHGYIRPALDLLQRSLSIVPSFVDAQILMGRILEGNGLASEAIAVYRQALILNSNGPSAARVRGTLERLLISSVSGSYLFSSSNDASTDSTYSGATLGMQKDGTFLLSNPDFETPDRQSFAVVESGTYEVADSTITFHVQKQEPPGYAYYYLFQAGRNTLLYRFEQGQLVMTGSSTSGGFVSLWWRKSPS